MSSTVPPEFLPPEARGDRIAELQALIAREWMRYAIVEAVCIFLPLAGLVAVFVLTDTLSETAFQAVGLVFFVTATALLVWHVVHRRIRPLSRELEALQRLEAEA
jgi:hypothetical protein